MSPVEMDELAVPSDIEESEDEKPAKPESVGTTLFVRNVQFEATEDELFTV
jgi:nucleolar protein 4